MKALTSHDRKSPKTITMKDSSRSPPPFFLPLPFPSSKQNFRLVHNPQPHLQNPTLPKILTFSISLFRRLHTLINLYP